MDIDRKEIYKLERWLSKKEKIIASIAPSYKAEFKDNDLKAVGALKSLGFYGAEETISVLPEIAEKRLKAIESGRKPLVFNSCPIIWDLIETHYNGVKDYLLVIPSPMILHGRRLKHRYPDAKIVFIGPCMAKKWEQEHFHKEKSVDMVLTFKEIRYVFKEFELDIEIQEEGEFLSHPPSWCMLGLLVYYKSGFSEVVNFLDNFDNQKKINGMELLACKGGCINGPGMTNGKTCA